MDKQKALSPQPSALSPQPSALSRQPTAVSSQLKAQSSQLKALSPKPKAHSRQPPAHSPQNELYPVFLKVNQLKVLLVGGGNVGLEKLSFLLKSSPNANVEVVATRFLPELLTLAQNHNRVTIIEKKFKKKMLKKRHLVIACTDNLEVNRKIYNLARKRFLLCNIADTPDLCDYYLGGIVTKGQVKIAISTNGKSPTTAKRLREFFEEVIPEEISTMVENLNEYRKTLKGDFEEKVQKMNAITKTLNPNKGVE